MPCTSVAGSSVNCSDWIWIFDLNELGIKALLQQVEIQLHPEI
jgi:hypothetical protein